MKDNIQSILAILFTGALIAGFFMGLVPVEAFLSLAGGAIGYFFSEKKQEKIIAEKNKTIEQLMVGTRVKIINEKEIPRV